MTFRSVWVLLATLYIGCGESENQDTEEGFESIEEVDYVDDVGKADRVTRNSFSSKHLEMLRHIREAARESGLSNAAALAGVGLAETGLAHCWSDATWACQGPYSADCGGPVIAGAGDGPCSWREGGLGMFQFDAGTFDDTIAREGRGVLTIRGNIKSAVDFVAKMLIDSPYVNVSNRSSALAWLSGVKPGTTKFNTWIKAVTHHYNGCEPNYCSIYWDRFDHYAFHAKRAFNEVSPGFWGTSGGTTQPSVPEANEVKAMEVWWARRSDGTYDFKALGASEIKTVKYMVDGYVIAENIPRDNPSTSETEDNFPAQYSFGTESMKRKISVEGFDDAGRLIGRGVGLIDTVPGTAVAIRQLGPSVYQISLERAPDDVTTLGVTVDGFNLKDATTNAERSPRLAIRTSFTRLGERNFILRGYNDAGDEIVRSERTFTLE